MTRIDGYVYDDQPPILRGPKPFSNEKMALILNEKRLNKIKLKKNMDKTFNIFYKNRLRDRQTKYTSWTSVTRPRVVKSTAVNLVSSVGPSSGLRSNIVTFNNIASSSGRESRRAHRIIVDSDDHFSDKSYNSSDDNIASYGAPWSASSSHRQHSQGRRQSQRNRVRIGSNANNGRSERESRAARRAASRYGTGNGRYLDQDLDLTHSHTTDNEDSDVHSSNDDSSDGDSDKYSSEGEEDDEDEDGLEDDR